MKADKKILKKANDIVTLGLTADEVLNYYSNGGYGAIYIYNNLKAQEKIDTLHRDFNKWKRMWEINSAHSGIFSSDRTIKEYASGILRI